MDQSVATSQGHTSPKTRLPGNWKSVSSRYLQATSDRLLALLSTAKQIRHSLGSGTAAPLDIDGIAARLGVERRSRADAENEQPASAEEVISGTQKEIVVHFRELQRKAQLRVAAMANKIRKFRQGIDLPGASTRLRDIPSRCENQIIRLIAESQSRLDDLSGPHELAEDKSPQDAKAEDKKDDGPVLRALHWTFTAVLAAAAAVAISKLTVPGYGSAEIVPAEWAILTSLAVVAVAFMVASVYSRAANSVGQVTYLLGILAGIGCLFVASSLAAYYIATVSADSGAGYIQFFESVVADPIAIITSVADWRVFGIVFGTGLLTYLVNYAPVSRPVTDRGQSPHQLDRMRRKRALLAGRLRRQINAIVDRADKEVTRTLDRVKNKVRRYSLQVDESKRAAARLGDYNVSLEDGCNIMLDRYRAMNSSTRQTEVPASFSEHICFGPDHQPQIALLEDEEARLVQMQQVVADLDSEAARLRQTLRDLNAEAIRSLDRS